MKMKMSTNLQHCCTMSYGTTGASRSSFPLVRRIHRCASGLADNPIPRFLPLSASFAVSEMSRRAIKRYEEALEADKALDPNASDDSDDDHRSSGIPSAAPGRDSLFALLSNDKSDEDDLEEEKEENSAAENNDNGTQTCQQNENGLETAQTEQLTDNVQTKKKKKRRKRKNAKKPEVQVDRENDPDWIALNESTAEESELGTGYIPDSYFSEYDNQDIRDEAKKIMAMIEDIILSEQRATTDETSDEATQVDVRLLNADSELKKLFGSRVVESERRHEDVQNTRRRRAPGRPHARRRMSLVSPRENWFGHAPGLAMVIDSEPTKDNAEGIQYFRYKHEGNYARLQDEYRTIVNMHDPNMLVDLARQHPYHVDTLLQLAEVYRQTGELDRAAETVERCLYVQETAWNLSFKPYDGKCRLRFDLLENRSLYVALFRYSQLLTRRGLHRTALEISKLLLNLDPENDPMGMLMLADSFALLSGEYEWVKQMRSSYRHIPIKYFPNFAASEAFACQAIQLGMTGIANRGKKSGKKNDEGEANGSTSVGDPEELLVDALLTFPMLLRPLLAAIQDSSTVWAEHRLYDENWYTAGYDDYGVLIRMCRVYAERSKLLWNSSQNKELLLRCARKAGALDTAAGMGIDPKTGRTTSALVKNRWEHSRVAQCRDEREAAGNWLRNSKLYQHVQIADFTDSTTNLPAELLAGEGADRTVGATTPRQVSITQGAMEFFQSLLPWRNANDATNTNGQSAS